MVLFYTGPKVVTHCFAQLGVVSSTCYYFTVLYSSRGRKQDYRHYDATYVASLLSKPTLLYCTLQNHRTQVGAMRRTT